MGVVKLSNKVTVYVPTVSRTGNSLGKQAKNASDQVARKLSGVCGGATSTEGLGYWVNDEGTLVTEKVILVTAYAGDLEESAEEALRLANWIRITLHQEAVSVEINGELHLVG